MTPPTAGATCMTPPVLCFAAEVAVELGPELPELGPELPGLDPLPVALATPAELAPAPAVIITGT